MTDVLQEASPGAFQPSIAGSSTSGWASQQSSVVSVQSKSTAAGRLHILNLSRALAWMFSPPYTVQLDQPTALRLTEQGGSLLILGMAERSVVTIDQQVVSRRWWKRFIVGPRFQGVKMIPPGAHFIGYSAVSKTGEVSPTTWFFLNFVTRQVVVRRWESLTELLLPLQDEEEAERYALGVRRFDFDSTLAPYNLQEFRVWQRLSGCIQGPLIQRLVPAGAGQTSITAEIDPQATAPPSVAELRLEDQLQSSRDPQGSDRPANHEGATAGLQDQDAQAAASAHQANNYLASPHYTPVPRLAKVAGRSAQELTQLNLDKSPLLEDVLSKCADSWELVGEFQYAFIAFLMGQSLQAFMQWKAILQLALSCSAAVAAHIQLYEALLRAMSAQLALALPGPEQHSMDSSSAVMGPMLIDGLMESSFLQPLLTGFRESLPDDVPETFQAAVAQVLQQLSNALGWDSNQGNDSEDEFAPVVVDL